MFEKFIGDFFILNPFDFLVLWLFAVSRKSESTDWSVRKNAAEHAQCSETPALLRHMLFGSIPEPGGRRKRKLSLPF